MFLERVNHGLDVLAVNLHRVQEVQDLIEWWVGQDKHVLGQSLYQAEEAALGVEPSVRSQLLLEGLQTLHNSRDTEGIVTLRAIKGTDHQVNDTQMENLSGWFLNRDSLFFFLKAFH